MPSIDVVLIVSGVLGSICAVLLLLLLYLIRAVYRKDRPRTQKERHYPPGIIVQDNIPEFMPETVPHRVQNSVSTSPPHITAEQLDTRSYGPDMSKFFGHRHEGNCYTSHTI